ncbi:MAG: tRNA (adenosine(37)-N6)-threonylcarbamoyltransferase complex ATPase subunit type 1 TsaE [Anaerolineales bacterium]|nr:tRNA (adenosine(37)-N6)-threonylcarbamoyltransferase complex ATPase subunit type 1 TsaE [Anaerolineales bacterium]
MELVRRIGRGWGSTVRVTSPTFTLINEYPRLPDGRILYHVDGYRLESEGDIFTSGLEDVLESGGAMMIEWPERVESVLPADNLWITFTYVNEMRRSLRFVANGERSMTLLREFRQRAFGV